MNKIEIIGELITIKDTTFNLKDIVSIQPMSLVEVFMPKFGGQPKITAKDFPKILVQTKNQRLEFAYTTDEERDEVLRELMEKYKIAHKALIEPKNQTENKGGVSINIADSSNVNIISGSSDSTITTHTITEAKDKIAEIKDELAKLKGDYEEEANEIAEVLVDIENKITQGQAVPKLTFKSLISSTSNFSTIGSLVISLGQILGYIPAS